MDGVGQSGNILRLSVGEGSIIRTPPQKRESRFLPNGHKLSSGSLNLEVTSQLGSFCEVKPALDVLIPHKSSPPHDSHSSMLIWLEQVLGKGCKAFYGELSHQEAAELVRDADRGSCIGYVQDGKLYACWRSRQEAGGVKHCSFKLIDDFDVHIGVKGMKALNNKSFEVVSEGLNKVSTYWGSRQDKARAILLQRQPWTYYLRDSGSVLNCVVVEILGDDSKLLQIRVLPSPTGSGWFLCLPDGWVHAKDIEALISHIPFAKFPLCRDELAIEQRQFRRYWNFRDECIPDLPEEDKHRGIGILKLIHCKFSGEYGLDFLVASFPDLWKIKLVTCQVSTHLSWFKSSLDALTNKGVQITFNACTHLSNELFPKQMVLTWNTLNAEIARMHATMNSQINQEKNDSSSSED